MTERSIIKDVRFDFRYVRPRVLMGLSVVLAVYVVWLALHPTQIDIGPRLGVIDLIARSLPTPARIVFCCALAVLLLLSAHVIYWPCIRDASMIIFDGRRVHGFDLWGRRTSLLRSEVEAVGYRYGGASVRGKGGKVWIPISLLNTDEEHRASIRSFLNKTVD